MVTTAQKVTRVVALTATLGISLVAPATADETEGLRALSNQLKQKVVSPADLQILDDARQRAEAAAKSEAAWASNVLQKRQEQAADLIRKGALPISGTGSTAPDDEQPFPNRAIVQGAMTYILVSWSMPRSELLEIMTRMEGKSAAIVFRGIPDSTSMVAALEQMNSLTVESKSEIPVLIDPFIFSRTNTKVVPTVVRELDQKIQAKISGLSTTDYLDRAVADGKSGDLGVHGPVLEIREPDFMTVVQSRIENLDFGKMKQSALARFWKHKKLELLPTASESATRLVSATIMIPQDIKTPAGDVVAKAGPMNPLKLRRFSQRVVVIDATSPWQADFARNQVSQYSGQQRVTVITTNVDAEDGWSTFGKTSDYIGVRLGLLDRGLRERFQIRKVPSVLTANDSDFIVQEFSRKSAEEGL